MSISHREREYINLFVNGAALKKPFHLEGLFMVPKAGIEPACPCERWILSPVRLPISLNEIKRLRRLTAATVPMTVPIRVVKQGKTVPT